MKCFSLPPRIDALIFDVDLTLYSHAEYGGIQISKLIERMARHCGVTAGAMDARIGEYRALWAAEHGGAKTSLANAFAAFGVPIEESVRWREELIRPEDYLTADPELRETLVALKRVTGLAVVTNNPASIGRRTVEALGVGDLFGIVIGLDSCGVSKPHEAPFRLAARELGAPPVRCVSIGDRYDIDLAVPLTLGMGGILVEGVRDVYGLPLALADRLRPDLA